MIRLLHAADLHLDTPYDGVRDPAPEVRSALVDSSLRAFDGLVSLAIEHHVDALLLAGDLYDGAERGLRAQHRLLQGLTRLSDTGIRTFIVHGNHDPVGEGWSDIETFPELVHVFSDQQVESVSFTNADGDQITVHGISFATRAMPDNLSRSFRAVGSGTHVGLLHANVGANPDHDPYAPCTADDLAAAGMHYWALGHIHTRTIESKSWGTYAYPGNLQGRSFKPSECGPKGPLLVQVPVGVGVQQAHVTPLTCDVVRFLRIEVDVTGMGVVDMVDAVTQQVRSRQVDAGVPIVARVDLVGRTSSRSRLDSAIADGALRTEVREALPFSASAFAWVDALSSSVRAHFSLDTVAQRDDFTGEVVRAVQGLSDTDMRALAQELVDKGLGRSGLPPAVRSLATNAFATDGNKSHDLVDELRRSMALDRDVVAELLVDRLDPAEADA